MLQPLLYGLERLLPSTVPLPQRVWTAAATPTDCSCAPSSGSHRAAATAAPWLPLPTARRLPRIPAATAPIPLSPATAHVQIKRRT